MKLKDPTAEDLDSILEISRDIGFLASDQQRILREKLEVLTARLFPHASATRILKQLDRIYSSCTPEERAAILAMIKQIPEGKLIAIIDIIYGLIQNREIYDTRLIELIEDLEAFLPRSFWSPLPEFLPSWTQSYFIPKEKRDEWGSFWVLLCHEVPTQKDRRFFFFQIPEEQKEQVIEHTMRLIRDIEEGEYEASKRPLIFHEIHPVPWSERSPFIEAVEPHLKGLDVYPRAASLSILRRIPQGERATAAPNVVLLCEGVTQLGITIHSMVSSLEYIPDAELAHFVNVVAPKLKGLAIDPRITSLKILGRIPTEERDTVATNIALLCEGISDREFIKNIFFILDLLPSDRLADFVNFVAPQLIKIPETATRVRILLAIFFLSPTDLEQKLSEILSRVKPEFHSEDVFKLVFEELRLQAKSNEFLIQTLNTLRSSGKIEEAKKLAQMVQRHYSKHLKLSGEEPLNKLVTGILSPTET